MWRLLYPLRYFRLDNREKQRLDLWASIRCSAYISAILVYSGHILFSSEWIH